MAEVVGGTILSSLIQVLVESLGSLVVTNFFQKNPSVSKLLKKLNDRLLSASSLLNDAEDKEVKDKNVKIWIDELSEELNKADIVIDVINTKALRRKVEGKRFLEKIVPTSFSAFDGAIKLKINEVIERLDDLLGQTGHLGLNTGVPSKRLDRSPAPLIGDPSDVYGRDGDKEVIVKLLLSENTGGQDKISVIPIVGMGGVGKTTLARLVYDDIRVKNHFEHRAWVTVSDDFDVLKLAKLVFEDMSSRKSEANEIGRLREELKNFLGGKKFFLVLDDVWNESYDLWDSLMSCFQVGSDGSKIIVTTRSKQIGSKIESVPSHPLALMKDEDCWELFQKHTFRSVEERTERLETIGREIVKKCKGLPLAVMSLARLLRSVSDPREWEEIKNSDVWELQRIGEKEILPSLWLSYSYLPSNLKCCFAYCSIFPKDYEFEKENLILLWMAEGLLEGENMEDVGEKYFKTLVSSSLLQRSAKDESSFVMHDLVHDLATFVSGKGFCVRLGKGDGLECFTSQTRHLLDYSDLADFEGLADSLRTFISMVRWSNSTIFDAIPKKFGCLRVLRISSWNDKKVPDSIGKLKHIRYLDLSDITKLPDSICRLYNLQTLLLRRCGQLSHLPANMENLISLRHLDISETQIAKLPDSIGKLKHLRYLDLSGTEIAKLPDSVCTLYNLQTLLLRGCRQLTYLPANMENLIKLRHLDIGETHSLEVKEIPQCVYKVKVLRMQTKIVVGRGSRINELIKSCYSIEFLDISGLENIVDMKDVLEVEFKEKSNVTELNLEWVGESNDSAKDKAILDAFQPHPNLKKLGIKGYGGIELSDWVANHSLSNITEVFLRDCKHCFKLPQFGQLPSLTNLLIMRLKSVKTIGSEFYGSSGATPFPCLKSLYIEGMIELESWSFEAEGAFPCLEELDLGACPKLKWISPHRLPMLKTLVIWGCPEMEALVAIEQEMNAAFPALQSITISLCPKVELSGLPLPSTLNKLYVYDSNMVYAQRMQWGALKALKTFYIVGCKAESFPEEEGLLPTTLVELCISHIPNLKSLNGKALQQLTSLEYLDIYNCPNLECLPEEGLPASLRDFQVYGSPILKRRIKRGTGEDWLKISHIPQILYNHEKI